MAPHATQKCMAIRRCGNCKTLLSPDAVRCPSCRCANLEPAHCSGTGSIVSSKVVEPIEGGPEEEPPVTLAIVELDDGPWVYSKIEGEFPERADEPVRVEFQSTAGGDGFPVFGVCAA
ncbi:OB-fold domain-containing protein [Rhodococcus sp. NPDC047139]|uniref:Zn-ribbon domain-containing OB-fold protein n=1 Tax=Rhodococcus sp. NPDC047139 TaxID=3155141 RepID=UPI0033BFC2CE